MDANIFLSALPSTLRRELTARFGDNVPRIVEGWPEFVADNERQVDSLPEFLDEFGYLKMFPSRRTSETVKSIAARLSDMRSLGLEGNVTPFSDRYVAKLRHYAKGLCLMFDLGKKMGIPERVLVEDPVAMMGYNEINHQGYLEFGVSLTQDKPFPDYIVRAAIELLHRRTTHIKQAGIIPGDQSEITDYLRYKASYPRGKNTGLPWMAGGKDRLTNDLVLAIDAALSCALVRGYPLDKMFSGLALGYVVFSRYQRSNKDVPMLYQSRKFTTYRVEPRNRIINSTPKILALAVKPLIKWTTQMHVVMPEFEQDRHKLSQRVKKAKVVRASDASRFDLRSGGKKLNQGLHVLWEVAKMNNPNIPDTVRTLMFTESELPTMVTVQDARTGTLSSRWSHEPALRSGASTTSRVGSIMNLMYDMVVTSQSEGIHTWEGLVEYYIKEEPSVIQGDDLLKLFRDRASADRYFSSLGALQSVGMEAEEEIPTKFLGYIIRHNAQHQTPNVELEDRLKQQDLISATRDEVLFHSANPLANMFFPERFRDYAVASMLSRYVILKTVSASQVISILTRISQDEKYAHVWYTRFYEEMMPTLEKHYRDHPTGQARVYFSTLLKPQDFSLDKLSRAIRHDVDELLRHIAQNTRFDFNPALFGEATELTDLLEAEANMSETEVVSTLADLAAFDSSSLTAGRHDNVRQTILSDVLQKRRKKDDRIGPLLALFDQKGDDDFVTLWRSLLPQTSRQISSPFGDIFVANL